MKRQDARTPAGRREPDGELDRVASEVVAAAIEVHQTLGPGFLESVYDLLVADRLVVELKAIEALFNVTVLLRGVRRVILTRPSNWRPGVLALIRTALL